MSALSLLKGCPLFYELYDSEIESIIKHCGVASFANGDHILKTGDEGTDIFVLLSGEASVKISKGKNISEIAKLRKGDVFGELVLINLTKRAADIVCDRPCDVLIIKYETIFSLYHKNTKVFSVLLLNLSRLLTKRLKSANETIKELSSQVESMGNKAA